jgi:hypothetical protein
MSNGKNRFAAAKKQGPLDQRFSWFLMVVGLAFLGLGAWGIYQGAVTSKWPRAPAVILHSDLRVRDSTPNRSSGQRDSTASVAIRYEYTVEGRKYIGDGIEVVDFGLQNSAAARKQHDKYPGGSTAQVAYDPANPAIAYLEPGPSSMSLMLGGIGLGLVLLALLIRRAVRPVK